MKNENYKRVISEEYWIKKLYGFDGESILPTLIGNELVEEEKYEVIRIPFAQEIIDKEKNQIYQEGFSQYTVLFAIFLAVIKKYRGSEGKFHIACCGDMSDQSEYFPAIFDFSNDITWRALFELTKRELKNIWEHSYVNFCNLVDEYEIFQETSPDKFWQVVFQISEEEKDIVRPDKCACLFAILTKKENCELYVCFNRNEYLPEILKNLLISYRYVLTNLVENCHINMAIDKMDYLNGEQCKLLIQDFNSNQQVWNGVKTMHEYVELWAVRIPDKIAVKDSEGNITYAQLNGKANQLAYSIKKKGIQPGDIIGLLVEEATIPAIISILAIMKTGAVYCPINASNPKERIEKILEDSNIKLVISVCQRPVPLHNVKKIALEELDYKLESDKNLSKVLEDSLAYIIYTSGSTGTPKGVMIEHRNIVNQMEGLIHNYGFHNRLKHVLLAPFTFDPSIQQIFLPLATGAELNLIPNEKKTQPDLFWNFVVENGINIMNTVPSLMEALIDESQNHRNGQIGLEYIILAGEVFHSDLEKRLRAEFPGTCIMNIYGPTEASVNTTLYVSNPNSNYLKVPIGKPLANYLVYVLDEEKRLVPLGASGELYISGAGLARGYINDPEMTQKCFVPNPFSSKYTKMYRTGDLVRWLPGGYLDFVGRADNQVKIRGMRVELSEIETRLEAHPIVKECAVIKYSNAKQIEQLAAFYTLYQCEKGNDRREELKKYLQNSLPSYMIPDYYVELDRLPMNANHKLDRRAFPLDQLKSYTTHDYIAPETELECQITKLWQSILGKKKIGINDSFFEVGGNSLSVVRLAGILNKNFSKEFTVAQIFTYHTIHMQAEFIRNGGKTLSKINTMLDEKKREEFSNNRDIAIIGINVVFPMALRKEEFWKNLCENVDSIRPISQERLRDLVDGKKQKGTDLKGAFLDRIDGFDSDFFQIAPNEAKMIEPQQRILLEVAWNAVLDAGYGKDEIDGTRTGVFVGAGSSDYMNTLSDIESSAIVGNLRSAIAGRISYVMNLKGPSEVIDTACSSSLIAIHHATLSLLTGESELALAGGINVYTDMINQNVFHMGIASPSGKARTFDASSDGTSGGEGAGIVVLKTLQQAQKDGDHIYAVIKGSAVGNDGRTNGITAPSAQSQSRVIEQAWKSSGVDPESISYIEAHGTGTKLGDAIELEGITEAFRLYTDKKQFCGIGSVKTNIGHLDAAAGIAGFVKTALALYYKRLPKSLNFRRPNPEICMEKSPVYLIRELTEWKPVHGIRRAGISGFGLSGTNCHIILEEYIEEEMHEEKTRELFTLSAKTEQALKEYILQFISFVHSTEVPLQNICYTVNKSRSQDPYRIAIYTDSKEQLAEKLKICLLNDTRMLTDTLESDGIYTGREVQDKNVVSIETIGEQDLALAYCNGALINWNQLYRNRKVRRVSLPLYPFQNKRFWGSKQKDVHTLIEQEKGISAHVKNDLLYDIGWVRKEMDMKVRENINTVILFQESSFYSEQLIAELKKLEICVIRVFMGEVFKKLAVDVYVINAGNSEDYERLLDALEEDGICCEHILHTWTLTHKPYEVEYQNVSTYLKQGVYSIFFFIKALEQKSQTLLTLGIVTNYAQVVGEEDKISPDKSALMGMLKVISQEYPKCRCFGVEIPSEAFEEHNVNYVLDELFYNQRDVVVVYREKRYIQEMKRFSKETYERQDISIQERGVYVIIGGAGGLGIELCKYLGIQWNVTLIIINRYNLEPKENWLTYLEKNNGEDSYIRAIRSFIEIESSGSSVYYYSGDITDYNSMQKIFTEIQENFTTINGVFHCAAAKGSISQRLNEQSEERFTQVLSPKIQGSLVLDSILESLPLDFLVLYSSLASFWGGASGCDYTAANCFMDAYSIQRNARGRKTLAVNWYAWKGLTGPDCIGYMEPSEAIACLVDILPLKMNQIIIGEFDKKILKEWKPLLKIQLSNDLFTDSKKEDTLPSSEKLTLFEVKLKGNEAGNYSWLEKKIANIWGLVLGYEEINIYDNFFDIGGDSILILKLLKLVKEQIDNEIEVADLFSYCTIADLADFIEDRNRQEEENEKPLPEEINDEDKGLMELLRKVKGQEITVEDAVKGYEDSNG